jgi:hypothetical protein
MSVTGEEVREFLKREGKRGERVLSKLQKMKPVKEALETEIGKILIQEIAEDMDLILEKIIAEEATDVDRADFRAGKRLAGKVSVTINTYYKEESKIRHGSK